MLIDEKTKENFLKEVNEVLLLILQNFGSDFPKEGGGFFRLWTRSGKSLIESPVGDIPPEEEEIRDIISKSRAEKKVQQIEKRNELTKKDPEENVGAIVAGLFVLSFSGLPSHADEALCLGVAVKMGWLEQKDATKLASINQNQYWKKLKKLL